MGTSTNRKYVVISEKDVDRYVRKLKDDGISANTQQTYRRMLRSLYDWLPEDKRLGEAELAAFLEDKREQYSVGTLNNAIAAVNGLLRHLGRHELCLEHRKKENGSSAELTREEYLRLLAAGRKTQNRGGYVLIKLFGNTPLHVQELEKVTVEAAQKGELRNKEGERVALPGPLCRELLDYAQLEGVTGGAIFRTRSGVPIDRTVVHRRISELGEAAAVASEKVNPRSLRRLHLQMLQELQLEYEAMIGRSYERQLEAEQRLIGWTEGIGQLPGG